MFIRYNSTISLYTASQKDEVGNNISAKNHQNRLTCVEIIANQRWDVFGTQCVLTLHCI